MSDAPITGLINIASALRIHIANLGQRDEMSSDITKQLALTWLRVNDTAVNESWTIARADMERVAAQVHDIMRDEITSGQGPFSPKGQEAMFRGVLAHGTRLTTPEQEAYIEQSIARRIADLTQDKAAYLVAHAEPSRAADTWQARATRDNDGPILGS